MISQQTPTLTLYHTASGWCVLGHPTNGKMGPYLTKGRAESKRNIAERRLGKLADKPQVRAGEIRLRDLILLAAAIGAAVFTLWPS